MKKGRRKKLIMSASLIGVGLAVGMISGYWLYKDKESREYSEELLREKARKLKKMFKKDESSNEYDDHIGI